MHLKVVEPLRLLFKDEVRKVGLALGLPDFIIKRHPFPVRAGNTYPWRGARGKLEILKEAMRFSLKACAGMLCMILYGRREQCFFRCNRSGNGDERTYENTIVLRAVNSTDGMTADWSHLPYEFLAMFQMK